ncbi:MAG: DUF4404 family protein [Pseudomonadales bacterium]
MNEKHLVEQLEVLRVELESADAMQPERRDRVLNLIADMEAQLTEDNSEQAKLVYQAEEMVTEFEVSHPTMAAVLNRIIQTLSNMGV